MIQNIKLGVHHKVLPLIYDNSLSYYEQVCKLTDKMNEIIQSENDYSSKFTEMVKTLNEFEQEVAKIGENVTDLMRGKYIENYITALSMWIDNNLQEVVGRIAKFVQFGITKDGYFYADIPENWSFLKFDTVVDENDSNYGCLVVKY